MKPWELFLWTLYMNSTLLSLLLNIFDQIYIFNA